MNKRNYLFSTLTLVVLLLAACAKEAPPHSNLWLDEAVNGWQNPDPEVRRDTRMRVLREGYLHIDEKDIQSLEFFHRQAQSDEDAERETAAAVLGLINSEQSLPILRALSNDPNEFVRTAGLRALWQYELAIVEQDIINGLDDESDFVRREAANLLKGRRAQYSTEVQAKLDAVLHNPLKNLVTEEPTVTNLLDNNSEVVLDETASSPFEQALVDALENRPTLIDIAIGSYQPGSIEAAIVEGDLALLRDYIEVRNVSPNLKVGQPIMDMQHSLLMLAALTPHEEIAEYLIDKGADVNYQSAGVTPLLRAVTALQLPVVKVLSTRGADLDHVNELGHSALTTAMREPEGEILEYLLQQGAAVNKPHHFFSSSWSLPLIKAAEIYNPATVALLLRYGADANAIDSQGDDALVYSIKRLSLFSNCCNDRIRSIHEEEIAVIQALMAGGATVQQKHLELLDEQYRPALENAELNSLYTPYYEEVRGILSRTL